MGELDAVEQWALESILRPVLTEMLEPGEQYELRLLYVDNGHSLIAEVSVNGERFCIYLVTQDAAFETDSDLRFRIASELQDEFASSSFAWGTLRSYTGTAANFRREAPPRRIAGEGSPWETGAHRSNVLGDPASRPTEVEQAGVARVCLIAGAERGLEVQVCRAGMARACVRPFTQMPGQGTLILRTSRVRGCSDQVLA